jgi:peptide/nickel transport system substrate-binding protein
MIRRVAGISIAIGAALLSLALVLEASAWLAWSLSGAGSVDVDSLAAKPAPSQEPNFASPNHKVREWAGPRNFREAPMLAQRVARGELPPVEQRLPENPLVVVPPEQVGPYGGLWRRYSDRPNDIWIANYYISNHSLLRWNPRGDGMQLNMAAEMPIVGDGGRSFTYKLRRGVKWSDGQPFTADDIVFWFQDVLLNPELTPVVPSQWRPGGRMATLEKLDDFTIRFTFAEPNGLFLKQMTQVLDAMMLDHPAHYLKQFHARYAEPAWLADQVAQNKMTRWSELFLDRLGWRNPDCPRLSPWIISQAPSASKPVQYERNPYYWKVDHKGNQLPYIDRIEYENLDPEIIAFRLIAGKFGCESRYQRGEDYPLYVEHGARNGYHINRWIGSHGNGYVLSFNLNHRDPVLREIFNKKEFRIAVSHAIDRQALSEISDNGQSEPRQVCPPPQSPYYDPLYEKAHIEYDPAKARALLASIGLEKRNDDGILLRPDGEPLQIFLETSRQSRMHEPICEFLRAVGIRMDLQIRARDLFYQRKAALMYDAAMWTGADEFMPMLDPRWFLPTGDESLQAVQWGRWFNANDPQLQTVPPEIRKVMDLYRQLARTVDERGQKEIFQQILDLNRENLWVLGMTGGGRRGGVVLVNDDFHNVPQVSIIGSAFRTPGPAAPECWSMGQGEPLDE